MYYLGLVQGYQTEKQETDSTIQRLEEKQVALVTELESARLRLGVLEEANSNIEAREEEVRRQKEAIEKSIGSEQQGQLYRQ